MALDKLTIINNGGLSTTSDYRVGVLTATKFVGPIESDSATFTGSVSIGGTLTYEDVTNVDSVGLVTARGGVHIPDDQAIRIGNTFANSDLRISSSPSNQQVVIDYTRSGTGRHLRFRCTDILFENWNGLSRIARFQGGVGAGHAELYFAGNKKFETTAQGIEVTGHSELDNVSVAGVSTFSGIVAAGIGSTAITLSNSHKITLGSAHELELHHDGSNSYIKQRFFAYPSRLKIISENSGIDIMSGSGGNSHGAYENAISCENNGATKIYHAGVGPYFETYGAGVKFQGSIQVGYDIFHLGDTDTRIRFPTLDTISFDTAGSERIRIMSGGSIGIHTTTGTNTVNIGGAAGLGVRFHNFTSGNTAFITVESGDKVQSNVGGTGYYTWVTGGTEKMRLANNGRLGIGSDNPTRPLSIGAGDGTVALHGSNAGIYIGTHPTGGFQNNAAIARAGANNYHITGSAVGDLCIAGESTADIIIGTSAHAGAMAERLRITSTGNFGFGGVTPGGTPANKNVFLAIGDSDTGIVQDGDGQLEIFGNGVEVVNFNAIDGYTSTKAISTTDNITIGDSIIHNGDTNTKIRFPAADTITFETAGNEGLRIDANGNIGVNVTPVTSGTLYNTVDHFLAIGDNDTGIAQDGDGQFEIWANNSEIANFNTSQVTLTKTTRINNSIGLGVAPLSSGSGTQFGARTYKIAMGDYDTGLAQIADGTLGLYTNNSERLRIDPNGNIGVNAIPAAAGTLYNTVDHFLVIGDSDTGIAQDGDGQFEIWANNQEIANFSTASIDPKKSILPSGAINIGSDSQRISHIYTANLSLESKLIHQGDTDTFLEFGTNTISFTTAGTERLLITPDGNVGINVSPEASSMLHIKKPTGAKVTIESNDSNHSYINFSAATNEMSAGFDKPNDRFTISNHDGLSSNQRVVIKSGGNTGIGTVNPQSKLHISGGSIRVGNGNSPANENVLNDEIGHPYISGTAWFHADTYAYNTSNNPHMDYYWVKIVESVGYSAIAYIEYMAHSDSNYPRSIHGRIDIGKYANVTMSISHNLLTPATGITPQLVVDSNQRVWLRLHGNQWNSDFRFRMIYGEGTTLNSDFTVGTDNASSATGRMLNQDAQPLNKSGHIEPGATMRWDLSNSNPPEYWSGSNTSTTAGTYGDGIQDYSAGQTKLYKVHARGRTDITAGWDQHALVVNSNNIGVNNGSQPVTALFKSQKNTVAEFNRMYTQGILIQFRQNNDARGYIENVGTNTDIVTSGSDERLKKNFEDWTEEVLPHFKALKPKKFHFNEDSDDAKKTKGYIAQDNLDKFPEAYPENPNDDRYWFKPGAMVPYLMKALQEEIIKREEIEAKYNALEARIKTLEGD